ncbi:hypothetical protein CTKA_01783 [Chthonomonas calidirosea]|uniref:Uncharacterized conserved protein n=1 Tax=Chthonomonas calidirosea (strain DSM 23976 / ICMP 18418 / T49) TaxID=1303518 RepID=S0EZB0_CHTCT|nr:DUF1015 domain-containing protein [Chthonomonas calidirosea]CCW36119.1 Uncharacterized conserved protein [Chthonomonas calidirosea T49]CEK18283.1 hypothetical protein CTKA_01783 [Chthonomonas calidirosea]
MAVVQPFRGIHYDPQRVNLADVISPPYDVLSAEDQEDLYRKHPYNIVRLILNREEVGDNEEFNRYTRAAAFLEDALRAGVLVQDAQPCLYAYLQRFPHPLQSGRVCERWALLVALKLEPYENGVVLPHEETHTKAKEDRLRLMRATKANPEPIYGLYEDADGAISALLRQALQTTSPLLTAALPSPINPDIREEHIVYACAAPDLLESFQVQFHQKRVWIADGHHRYETALNYQREQGGPSTPPRPHDFILMGLTAFEDLGLVVLPTHRLVRNIASERLESLGLLLERHFHVFPMELAAARDWLNAGAETERRFVVVLPSKAYGLRPREEVLPESILPERHSEAWRRLDVSLLQVLVLDCTLGISWHDLAHTEDVAYTRNEEEAVQLVQSGAFQLACLLRPPRVQEIRDVAAAGDKMPQKSTYFYPKLYSGLILRSFPLEERE